MLFQLAHYQSFLCICLTKICVQHLLSEKLSEFYKKVRPGGFWGPVARENPEVQSDGLSLSRVGVWAAGCAGVFGLLFGMGKFLLGEPMAAAGLLLMGLLGGLVVGWELKRS